MPGMILEVPSQEAKERLMTAKPPVVEIAQSPLATSTSYPLSQSNMSAWLRKGFVNQMHLTCRLIQRVACLPVEQKSNSAFPKGKSSISHQTEVSTIRRNTSFPIPKDLQVKNRLMQSLRRGSTRPWLVSEKLIFVEVMWHNTWCIFRNMLPRQDCYAGIRTMLLRIRSLVSP